LLIVIPGCVWNDNTVNIKGAVFMRFKESKWLKKLMDNAPLYWLILVNKKAACTAAFLLTYLFNQLLG
jgi:hypothetical protein